MGKRIERKKRIGVFGGTFDPPHIGHQILAMEAYDELKLDRLFWVLAPEPPHKIGKKIAPLHTRIKMVMAAIKYDPIFEFSSVDIERPGPHYVLDTINIFRQLFPDDLLFFLIGGDSLHNLPDWHEPLEFIQACDGIGVMHRPGEKIDLKDLEKRLPDISKKIHFIEAPLLEISSDQIRKLISSGKPFQYYLSHDVYEIIKEFNLYQNDLEHNNR